MSKIVRDLPSNRENWKLCVQLLADCLLFCLNVTKQGAVPYAVQTHAVQLGLKVPRRRATDVETSPRQLQRQFTDQPTGGRVHAECPHHERVLQTQQTSNFKYIFLLVAYLLPG